MNSQKGQYFSFDAIIASVIFILTLVSLVSYWYSVRSTLESQNNEIGKEALRISDQLFLFASTKDCTAKTGFAMPDNKKLDVKLLSDCESILEDEITIKQRFSTPFSISLYIKPTTSAASCKTEYKLGYDLLSNPDTKIKNLVKISRIATLHCDDQNDVLATVDVLVYE